MSRKRRKCSNCGKELRTGQKDYCSERCRMIASRLVRRCLGILPDGTYCEERSEPGRHFCAACAKRNEGVRTWPHRATILTQGSMEGDRS